MNGTGAKQSTTGREGLPANRFSSGLLAVKKKITEMPILVMLVVLWVVFIFISKSFFTPNNIVTIFVANAVFAIAAIGETFVLMTGGIDLSIAQNLTCSSIVSAVAMITYQKTAVCATLGVPVTALSELAMQPGADAAAIDAAVSSSLGMTILIGILVAVGVGTAFGFLNGIAVSKFGMTPFITTLATQLLARGVSYVLSEGISISGTPGELTKMSYAYGVPIGDDFVIPWVVFIVVAMFVIFGIVLGKTDFGRHVTLTGSNYEAARFSGIRVRRITLMVYVIAGLLAGVAGFVCIMCLGTADPKVGDTMLITIIGSVILGGVSMTGGEGSVGKAALGVFMFATLINGMTFLNLQLYMQQIILGTIIIVGTALLAMISIKTRRA